MRYALSILLALICDAHASYAQESREPTQALRVLFIGNSYTARHNLAKVVEAMAEERDPDLDFVPTTVIYGGRRLIDHWRLGTRNFVELHSITASDVEKTIDDLVARLRDQPDDKYAKAAVARQRALLTELDRPRSRWDVVVLQSYRDDLEGTSSVYHQYARKFAELAKRQGSRVVLYETTPSTQNSEPIASPPKPEPVLAKARSIAELADEIDARVAPMSLVALQCQRDRPDLTLRFINDAHLNQTMAYMTACAIYAAIFDQSPEGIRVDSITDIRYWKNKDKTRDRDNLPITRTFSENDRSDMQRIVSQARTAFQRLLDQ